MRLIVLCKMSIKCWSWYSFGSYPLSSSAGLLWEQRWIRNCWRCPHLSFLLQGNFSPHFAFFFYFFSSILNSFHPIRTKKLSGKSCLSLHVGKTRPSADLLSFWAIKIAIRIKIKIFAYHGGWEGGSSKSNSWISALLKSTIVHYFSFMVLPSPMQF